MGTYNMLRNILALLLMFNLAATALGATPSTYTGATNGNWNTGTNWSTSPTVPLNSGPTTYDVTITSKTVNYNVSGTNAIQTLTLSGSTLKLLAGDNLSLVGSLTSSNSTISAANATFLFT